MLSHLTILIRRVKEVPTSMKTDEVFIAKLINLAEYLRYREDYTDYEKRKAKALLKAYNYDGLLVLPLHKFEKEVKELKKQTCMICSRTLNKGEKKNKGICRNCFDKDDETDLREWV